MIAIRKTSSVNTHPARRIANQKRRSILVEPTNNTPFVTYNRNTNHLQIKGDSKALNILEFYAPLISELKRNTYRCHDCHVELFFKTLNTSTVKILFDLFKFLGGQKRVGKNIKVTWSARLKDLEILETGMDFSELFDLNFQIGCY